MELQNYNLNEEEKAKAAAVGENVPLYKRIKFRKESTLGKWLSIIFSTEFLVEVIFLCIHPLPYYEIEFEV